MVVLRDPMGNAIDVVQVPGHGLGRATNKFDFSDIDFQTSDQSTLFLGVILANLCIADDVDACTFNQVWQKVATITV